MRSVRESKYHKEIMMGEEYVYVANAQDLDKYTLARLLKDSEDRLRDANIRLSRQEGTIKEQRVVNENTLRTLDRLSRRPQAGLAYYDIDQERKRQDEKWGEQLHPNFTWAVVLMEEVGEACKAALESKYGDPPEKGILRKELIQSAAVLVAWIECLDKITSADSLNPEHRNDGFTR